MAFTKFAKAQVLETKWAPQKVAGYAAFNKLADFSFNNYLTDDGYIYVRVRAISSRTNKNHDSWPADELAKSYRTFVGKPVFVDHHNHDPKRARGVVVDAELHIEDQKTASLDPYYSSKDVDPLHLPPTWVELLLEVDAKRFPRLAKAIISGEIDSVSMGADVGHTVCNICSNKAEDPSQFCSHIITKGAHYDSYGPDGRKTSKASAEHCYKVSFFELSFVFDPADETALTTAPIKTARKLSEMSRVASMFDMEDEGEMGHGDPNAPDSPGDELVNAGGDPRAEEPQRIFEWRLKQLIDMGYAPDKAAEIAEQEYRGHDEPGSGFGGAGSHGIDQHKLKGWIDKGLSPDQALEMYSKHKHADNPVPQSEMTRMPQSVNTLRQEKVCEVCGSDMEDGECSLCGYVEPPEGFDNPDLAKAKEVDQQLRDDQSQQQAAAPATPDPSGGAMPQSSPSATPMPMTSSYVPVRVLSHTDGQPVLTTSPGPARTVNNDTRTAAKQPAPRINTQEKPILPATRKKSDKPLAVRQISSPTRPLESKTREETMDNIKTADGASPMGSGVQAEKRVDVEGVGGVSGDPLSGISSEAVEKDTGDFAAPHTDTWNGGEGDSLGQQEPVTSEAFPGAESGDATGVTPPFGRSGAEHGVTPDKPSAPGFPDSDPDRIDLEAGLAEEVGDRTRTFGSDDFHITEPVTKGEDANSLGGPVGVAVSSFGFAVKAMRLAETEEQLGLLGGSSKWDRVAGLENRSEEYIDAQLETLSKVKTAGLNRTSNARTARRLPSLQPKVAGFEPETHGVHTEETQDSLSW